jgi:hypothetical protein
VKSTGAEEFHAKAQRGPEGAKRKTIQLDWHRVDAAGLSEKLAKEK